MSRTIKFRVWDNEDHQMTYLDGQALEWSHEGFKLVFGLNFHSDYWQGSSNNYELMQFTGLQDRTGKDIYEGDILRLEDSYHKTYEVYWNDDRWGLRHGKLNDYDNGDYYRGDDINNWHEFEVVGNIYEHPGLIRKKR